MEFRYVAFRQRMNAHVPEHTLLEEGGNVFHVARESIEALGDDDVECTGLHRSQHGLIVRPQHRSTRDGMVGIGIDECPAITIDAGAADPQLIVDRRIALVVRAVAGIDDGAQAAGCGRLRPCWCAM